MVVLTKPSDPAPQNGQDGALSTQPDPTREYDTGNDSPKLLSQVPHWIVVVVVVVVDIAYYFLVMR